MRRLMLLLMVVACFGLVTIGCSAEKSPADSATDAATEGAADTAKDAEKAVGDAATTTKPK